MATILQAHEENSIKEAIKNAELNTDGEIRVCIEKYCSEDPLHRAAYYFEKLEMHKTDNRNGVLIYLAAKSRKLAIIADKGINNLVDVATWNRIKDDMIEKIKAAGLVIGIIKGIENAGKVLCIHFPKTESNINELSDDVHIEEN
ncbi:MAG: TPM domain-containing protein [Solitalea-like symbiont of Acarus siro]